MDIGKRAVFALGDEPAPQVIVACYIASNTGGQDIKLKIFIDIDRGYPVFCLLNAVAVSVIEELGVRPSAGYGG